MLLVVLRSSHGPADVMPMAMNQVVVEVSLCYCDHPIEVLGTSAVCIGKEPRERR